MRGNGRKHFFGMKEAGFPNRSAHLYEPLRAGTILINAIRPRGFPAAAAGFTYARKNRAHYVHVNHVGAVMGRKGVGVGQTAGGPRPRRLCRG